ncbi:MAG: alpha/beta fold hydrolase, partial [Pseudomonadota bacterium]
MVALARTEHPPLETARADAAPMIVAHGLFGSGRNWATLAKRFAETRRVVSVDLRNHGDSPWTEEMDYPSMGADLLETVDDLGGRA